MSTDNVKIIKRYLSNLDAEIALATVSVEADKYFVEIFGEQAKEFASEVDAIKYAEKELQSFFE